MKKYAYLLVGIFILCGTAIADDKQKEPASISKFTDGMTKTDGYFPFYWDEAAGKIYLEIAAFDQEFLYVNYLSRGLGSNEIGLDRGQIGGTYVVYFRRIGPKVLLMERNYGYRAESDDPAERLSVDEAFAQSTLWGFEVTAVDGDRVLVDATKFLLRDARNVVGSLKRSDEGSFKLEASRSAIDLTRTKNFPKNTEFEAILTYLADSPGPQVRQVAPTPGAITLQQHHSFVELPDDKYEPRRFDVRSGYFGIDYMDFATPISEPITQRYISRHRLEAKDPGAEQSEPVEPIVYYIDRGAPEPIRTALIEGASWWNQAFEAAGFIDAFRVEVLPEDADPLDVRYNVILWVHRSSRGWSYGSAIVDPRTGEIIKGHISLGSLRARQDYLIAEGLLQPHKMVSDSNYEIESDPNSLMLARIRQLSAHEVGHTLGLRHNYAASTNDRASVMDYPYPYVKLAEDGSIDLSEAYKEGIGDWDRATIRYGYRDYTEGTNADSAGNALLDSVFATGLLYLSDGDARPSGSAHRKAHLWDNGENAVDELARLLEVRTQVLAGFSERAIPPGTPMVMLEEALVPIYMYHRYQIVAAAKSLGGLYYNLGVRDDPLPATLPVAADEQRRALQVLLQTIAPDALALPESLLAILPPSTTGLTRPGETFNRRTGQTFDPLSAAESVADITVRMILQPQRAARLVEYNARYGTYPGLGEVIDRLIAATWQAPHPEGYSGELQRVVDNIVLTHLLRLAANQRTSGQVRAIAALMIDELRDWLGDARDETRDEAQRAHLRYAFDQIGRFQEEPGDFEYYEPVEPPAGSPIGDGRFGCDWE